MTNNHVDHRPAIPAHHSSDPPDRRGDGVRRLIRTHPLTAFFVLAYGISWLAWSPYILSSSRLGLLHLQFPQVLGTTQLLGVLPGAYLGPLTSALVVTAVVEGRGGLRAWRRRLLHWRVSWRWYAGVALAVPAVLLTTALVLPGAWSGAQVVRLSVLAAYLPVLALQMATTGLAEEPGWRDFALPRLQQRRGPVVGTAVLGLLWGGWHLPLFLSDWGGSDVTWWTPVEFVVMCVPLSLVMTWVFNRTRGSVPVIMVLHSSINTVMSLVWLAVFPTLNASRDPQHVVLIASTVAAGIVLFATRGRLGLVARPLSEIHPK